MRRPSRRDFLAAAGAGAAALLAPRRVRGKPAGGKRPNIIFFLADDLGWMDSTVYGSRYYETPSVERLARRGMVFTDAYAANPLCSPTRASILTGKYPCRLGITTPAGHLPPRPDEPLMREAAPPWHGMITPRSRRYLPLDEHTLAEAFREAGYTTAFIGKWHLGHEPWWPKKQGFDINIAGGHYPGPPSYFSPYRIKTLEDGPEDEYLTDRLTDEALRFLESHRDRPFFLCFWHYAVHAPFQAKESLVERYRGRKDPRGKQDCPVMAAMVKSLDESLGRLLDNLDELRLADDTILVFFSDNGGNMHNTVEGTTPTDNSPLRNGKGSIYEGGVREPCIVVWPGVVEPGSRCRQVVSSIDFYPTLLEMAGIPARPGQLLDGESLVPLLRGEGTLEREAIFCHFPHYVPATGNLPATSVRKGPWKLIRLYGEGPDRSAAYELYNLEDDIGERHNLADQVPEKVAELDALIDRHLHATQALVPVPNPRSDPHARPRGAQKAVAGWRHSAHCTLSVEDGAMKVRSHGGDPYFFTSRVPRRKGPIVLTARIKSSIRGPGQAFWTTAKERRFHRSRRVRFPLAHDEAWHEVVVRLPVEGELAAVRLDPGTGSGVAEFDWIRLSEPDGRVVKTWDF
ncbi:MAG: sulfatase [Candidatus Brocadiia bacterium]